MTRGHLYSTEGGVRTGIGRSGLAAEAFFFGYPLVTAVRQIVRVSAEGFGPVPAAPFNTFAHCREAPGPMSELISVSNDTVFSLAQIDLAVGPVVLHVPDTGGRYYAISFIDVWTNNFAYVGPRATGTAEADFLLVPPGWRGELPPLPRIHAPTRVFTLVGRFALDGPGDMPALKRLQDKLDLRPVGADVAKDMANDAGTVTRSAEGPPEMSKQVCDDLRFWEELRTWMLAFPPSWAERDYARRFEPLGLLADPSPYIDPAPDLAWALRHGFTGGRERLEQLIHVGRPLENGWIVTLHAFDYNIDHFQLGTIEHPEWKAPDRAQAHIARALATRLTPGGSHAYEAAEAQISTDRDGLRLTGAHRYTLHLDPPPPTAAFWSLTMYDSPEYYLVDNPIRRYSIGSRTQGLRYGADGSLTIYLQNEPPRSADQAPNWLPAPPGDFRPMMRIYQPAATVLDGSYTLPPIVRGA
jgi:hypothetical protein